MSCSGQTGQMGSSCGSTGGPNTMRDAEPGWFVLTGIRFPNYSCTAKVAEQVLDNAIPVVGGVPFNWQLEDPNQANGIFRAIEFPGGRVRFQWATGPQLGQVLEFANRAAFCSFISGIVVPPDPIDLTPNEQVMWDEIKAQYGIGSPGDGTDGDVINFDVIAANTGRTRAEVDALVSGKLLDQGSVARHTIPGPPDTFYYTLEDEVYP